MIDGNVVLATSAHGDHAGFTFVDPTTAVVVFGDDAATKQGILRIAAGGGHLDQSPAFTDLFQHIHSEDTAWFVLTKADISIAGASVAMPVVHAVYGSIYVSDSVVLDGRVRLDSPASAASLLGQVQTKLEEPMTKLVVDHMVDAIDVTTDDSDLRVDLAMSSDEIASVMTDDDGDSDAGSGSGSDRNVEISVTVGN
jgi:hypothetical protein